MTVKIWDDKVDVIDDGKVVEEEVKFLTRMKYDPNLAKFIGKRRLWSGEFSYGLILLGLLAKRVNLKEDVVKFKYKTLDEWAYKAYEPQRSLVHTSVTKDKDYNESDAITLTELAMCCIQVDNPKERHTMSELINCLKNLSAFQEEVKFLAHPSVNHSLNLEMLIGFCSEALVNGGVYDLNLLDTF
ncbi:hypothetical protein LguiA_030230 [Lonicera macranthoides]